MAHKKLNILYVEDDEADAEFVRSALTTSECDGVEIHVIEDGEEASRFAEGEGKYRDWVMPDLVLLDLNLPKVSGKEVLKRFKASPSFRHLPVVIFSTSAVQAEVKETYTLGASGYVTKPSNFEGYKETMKRLYEYWTRVCTLSA